MLKKVLAISLLGTSCLLAGCASTGNPTATLNFNSAQYLNPNISGQASPVVVSVYQLKSPFAFKQATFDQLEDNPNKILGDDLLDKTTMEIRPGSSKNVTQNLAPNTQYLGIVAAYRNINRASWHKILKVNSKKGKNTSIHISLESQGIAAEITSSDSGFHL